MLFWFYIIISTIIIDQVSKILVQNYINLYSTISIIPGFLNFRYITNDGISFGWNPFQNSMLLFILVFEPFLPKSFFSLT